MPKVTSVGALRPGLSAIDAGNLFDQIEKFAGYGFNKSHATTYTLIAFQAAWLKSHYLIEFYAAALSVVHPDKLPSIVKQAGEDGIMVIPPDINVSTDRFEPISDSVIVAPLSSVMHVSSTAAAAVIAARTSSEPVITEKSNGLRGKAREMIQTSWGPGRFTSIEDVRARVAARALTSRGIENLDKVGAFARIEPGQPKANDPCRQRDQIAFMPGIMDQGVMADRIIPGDEPTADAMNTLIDKLKEQHGSTAVEAYIGNDPRFMVVLDQPLNDFEQLPSQFSYQQFIRPSLIEAGLHVEHACWTWAARRPKHKGEKGVPSAEIAQTIPFLHAEIAILKPPVIVAMGPAAAKAFFPDMKQLNEQVGKVIYSAELDASIIIGFNPGQIYHDETKRDLITNIFREVKRLIDNDACNP